MRFRSIARCERWSVRWLAVLGVALSAGLALAPSALARGAGRYAQRNLVSDQPGKAQLLDSSLVNAWDLAFGPMTPAWVANNGADNSTLYSGGVSGSAVAKLPLTVSIPGGEPTGMVYNGSSGFVIHSGASSGPASFLFSSESGKITGWNVTVPPPTQAQPAASVRGAIFKGLAIADTANGQRLYATDFRHGQVDVWTPASSVFTAAASGPEDPGQVRPLRNSGDRPEGVRQLREAESRCGRRRPRARQRLPRRLRHQRQAAAPLCPARANSTPAGELSGRCTTSAAPEERCWSATSAMAGSMPSLFAAASSSARCAA